MQRVSEASRLAFTQKCIVTAAGLRACARSVRAHSCLYHPTRHNSARAYQPRACRVRDATSVGHSTFVGARTHPSVLRSALCVSVRGRCANEHMRCLPLTRRSPRCRQPRSPCAPRGRLLCVLVDAPGFAFLFTFRGACVAMQLSRRAVSTRSVALTFCCDSAQASPALGAPCCSRRRWNMQSSA